MMKRLLMAVGCALLAAGCVEHRDSSPGAEGAEGVFHHSNEYVVSSRDYTIDPPDEIIIHCPGPGKAEFDGQKRKVAPDGTITLPMINEVHVAGLTTHECTKRLREQMSVYYRDPQLSIEVIDNSKFYYVVGPGVDNPGPKVYTGRDTVVQAVAEAGLNERGWPQQVLVTRPRKDGKGEGTTAVVDFKRIFEYGDLSQNYLLEKGDIVDLRMSPLAQWNFDVSKVVGPITGASAGIGASQSIVRPGKTGP